MRKCSPLGRWGIVVYASYSSNEYKTSPCESSTCARTILTLTRFIVNGCNVLQGPFFAGMIQGLWLSVWWSWSCLFRRVYLIAPHDESAAAVRTIPAYLVHTYNILLIWYLLEPLLALLKPYKKRYVSQYFQVYIAVILSHVRSILMRLDLQSVKRIFFSTFAWALALKMLEVSLPRLTMRQSFLQDLSRRSCFSLS